MTIGTKAFKLLRNTHKLGCYNIRLQPQYHLKRRFCLGGNLFLDTVVVFKGLYGSSWNLVQLKKNHPIARPIK